MTMPATLNPKPSYLGEFPRFIDVDGACAALLVRGCIDISWGQDACPSFSNAEKTLRIYVDYADPADREDPDLQPERFGISLLDDYGTCRDDVLGTNNLAEVFAYLDQHAARVLAWPQWMRTPIRSTAQAEACMRAMHEGGSLFHLDDDPASVVEAATGAPTFEREQVPYVSHRQQEIREHTAGDPHEYCLFLTTCPDSWRHLDDALSRAGCSRLSREQRECLDDSLRRQEALDMLDDLQTRCLGQEGAALVDAARNELARQPAMSAAARAESAPQVERMVRLERLASRAESALRPFASEQDRTDLRDLSSLLAELRHFTQFAARDLRIVGVKSDINPDSADQKDATQRVLNVLLQPNA